MVVLKKSTTSIIWFVDVVPWAAVRVFCAWMADRDRCGVGDEVIAGSYLPLKKSEMWNLPGR